MVTPADRVLTAAAVFAGRAQRDVPLGPLTTYRVGGAAALYFVAETEGDLALASRAIAASGIAVLVVGKGSNLLVADAGFRGLAIVLGEAFASIDVAGTTVRAGGAAALPVVARRTAAAALTGFEWAVGVPGSIGGAVRMNAGGHGSDIAACLSRVRVVDLARSHDGDMAGDVPATNELAADELDLGYRRSSIRPDQVVVAATLALRRGDRATAEASIAEIVRWRREHQPGGQNAGSVFANPQDDSAGRLIDAAGCKGLRVGSAHVSEKHANFFIAGDGGSADDVVALMREVQRRVLDTCGVRLEPETRLIGFDVQPPVESS